MTAPSAVRTAADPATGALLRAFAMAVAGLTFALVVAGGLVTSREAGLAVPDWPLSYGTLNPPRWLSTPNVREEHLHRLLGWALGASAVALACLLQARERRPWLRRLGWIALGLVVAQGVIGGLRVVLLTRHLQVVHGCLGQALFCLMVSIALFESRGWVEAGPPVRSPGARKLRAVAAAAAAAVFLQVVVGAVIRHSRVGHDMAFVWPHLALGLVACGLGLWAAGEAASPRREAPALRGPGLLLGGGLLAQVFLGFGTYLVNRASAGEIGRPAAQFLTATAHQALGAAVLASAVVLVLRAHRHVTVSPVPAAGVAFDSSTAGEAAA